MSEPSEEALDAETEQACRGYIESLALMRVVEPALAEFLEKCRAGIATALEAGDVDAAIQLSRDAQDAIQRRATAGQN